MQIVILGGVSAKNIDKKAMKDAIQSLEAQAAASSRYDDDAHSKSFSMEQHNQKALLGNSEKYANVVTNETIQKNLQYSLDVLSEDRSHHTKRSEQLNKEIEDNLKWKNENQPILDMHIER